MFKTIRGRLLAIIVVGLALPVALFAFIVAPLFSRFYLQQLREELTAQAQIIADAAGPSLAAGSARWMRLSRMVKQWEANSRIRVTIADAQGIIRAATIESDVATPIRETRRPGMRTALRGKANSTIWKNPRFGNEDAMYVNIPVRENGEIVGAVRVAYTLAHIQQKLAHIRNYFLYGAACYAVFLLIIAARLARSIVQPIEVLNRGALQIASGNLNHRIEVEGTVEIENLSRTLNETARRLNELEAMRRQFVADVSHELRTPLTAVQGMAEILMRESETNPQLSRKYLPRILVNTERLSRMARELLEIDRLQRGDLAMHSEPVALAQIIEEAIRTVADRAMSGGIEITKLLRPDLCLRGDRDRLTQVFLNLLDNAIRHTPEGGRINVSVREAADSVIAQVEDTGEGIPPEHIPHLFERFYQVDKSRSRQSGGSGLGLSIVREIVESHGGTIEVESETGEGTRFTMTFPAAASRNSLNVCQAAASTSH